MAGSVGVQSVGYDQRDGGGYLMDRFAGAIAATALVLLAGCGGRAAQAPREHGGGPFPPTVMACIEAHHHICNPTAYATMVAEDPLAHPPSAHPVYITRAQAVAQARRVSNAPAAARVIAKLMTREAYETLAGDRSFQNQQRKVWVVTVYANVNAMLTGKLAHYYTVAIDAETGIMSDIGFERALLK